VQYEFNIDISFVSNFCVLLSLLELLAKYSEWFGRRRRRIIKQKRKAEEKSRRGKQKREAEEGRVVVSR
jgi:hypothetical protein